MPRDTRTRSLSALRDMLDSARRAEGYLEGIAFAEFRDDVQLQDSVIRRIELIGEAAKRVEPSFQPELQDLSWRAVCGMRDVLIHQYDSIDLQLVFDTVHTKLPLLIESVEAHLRANNHYPDAPDDNPSDKDTP